MAQSLTEEGQLTLKCAARELDLSTPKIMGVLNVTPDSFSDGGLYLDKHHDRALARAECMLSEGASIIDVGGESTRPGARPVSVQEELDRVLGVVEAITGRMQVIVSVDTSTPEVMLAVADAGAGIINDVRALTRPGALETAARLSLPVCLMHMQGQPDTMQVAPRYRQPVADVYDFLQTRVDACEQAGISRHNIIIDPGFGFGKTLAHNLEILNQLDAFSEMNLPVLVGLSRKSMIGKILDKPIDDRLFGSISAATIAVMKGAKIIRCHDVAETADAVKLAAAVLNEQGMVA